jgi:phage tail-like protein
MKSTEIDRLLPEVFQQTLEDEHGPLRALLDVMETLHRPVESVLESIDGVFDAYRTPDGFVAYLSGWLDLDYLLVEGSGPGKTYELPSGTANLRELIAAGAELMRWRGTKPGLLSFLETATGVTGFAMDDQTLGPDGLPRPFHIRVDIPEAAERYRSLVDIIVRAERPAHITYELSPRATPAASGAPVAPAGGDANP